MAKAKEEKESAKSSLASMLKKYGDILSTGTNLANKDTIIFPVSPSLDSGLGGGIPEGSLASFIGPPGCGKSTTVLQILANVQKSDKYHLFNGKRRKIFYLDVEHRLKPMNMRGIRGLDPELINVIKSTKEHILTAQDFLDIAESLIKDPENEGLILVIDSSSALCPADELEAETSGQIRSTQPKIMAHWCRKMAAAFKVMSATVIIIQHLITNTSGYGEKWLVDGGEKLKYALDIKVMTKNKTTRWEENGVLVGQLIEWEIQKSGNSASGNVVTSCLRYGVGLDIIKETFLLCVDFGIIDKSGAWFSFEMNGETLKTQGEEKMCLLLTENKAAFDYISGKLYEIIT